MRSFTRRGLFGGLGVASAVILLSGIAGVDCGGSTPPPASCGFDGAIPTVDSGGVDSAPGPDAGSDATIDAAEASVDAAPDAPVDAGSDSGVDSGQDGGSVTPSPSCQPGGAGMTSCGSDGGESCCTSLEVTGGTYYRSYKSDADGGATGEADPASVSGFQMDKYLVTVGRFRQFVSVLPPDGGAGWLPPAGSGKHTHLNGGVGLAAGPNVGSGQTFEPGWDASYNVNIGPTDANLACAPPYDSWTSSPGGGQESLPINCVNWYEAAAFCIWDGGFLPSEAEWEYVAAGGNEQREYAWGTAVPGTACPGTGCEYAIYGCYYPSGGSGSCTDVTNIAPVGTATLGVGRWGQLDLTGDLIQWNLDWYVSSYANPCTDCAQLGSSSSRVPRGGGFYDSALVFPPSVRYAYPPTVRFYRIGFRCARTP